MKLCVFSDTHGYAGAMLWAVEQESPDRILHLGDGESDLIAVRRRFPDLGIENVRGNCDIYSTALQVLNMTMAGKRIFAAHGHMFGVKQDPGFTTLTYAALEAGADLVFFGHTHTPYRDHRLGMDIINPGACGRCACPTYAVVIIRDGRTEIAIREAKAY